MNTHKQDVLPVAPPHPGRFARSSRWHLLADPNRHQPQGARVVRNWSTRRGSLPMRSDQLEGAPLQLLPAAANWQEIPPTVGWFPRRLIYNAIWRNTQGHRGTPLYRQYLLIWKRSHCRWRHIFACNGVYRKRSMKVWLCVWGNAT